MTEPQLYLRKCNNGPEHGITIGRATVESALAVARTGEHLGVTIEGDLETVLTIHIPAGRPWEVELPGTEPRVFTYTPLPSGQHRADDRRRQSDGEQGEQ